jgi:hypothetical protein
MKKIFQSFYFFSVLILCYVSHNCLTVLWGLTHSSRYFFTNLLRITFFSLHVCFTATFSGVLITNMSSRLTPNVSLYKHFLCCNPARKYEVSSDQETVKARLLDPHCLSKCPYPPPPQVVQPIIHWYANHMPLQSGVHPLIKEEVFFQGISLLDSTTQTLTL